ncbi:MAG: hypothetical protein RL701_5870 [Pseudomonadota bacterium]|jgi:hypothetical protein
MEATIHVFVYRAGLLARLAHDLRLTVGDYELSVQGRYVRGVCAANSLHVDGVMTPKGLSRRILSFNDRQVITRNICDEVLQCSKYPRIEFAGEVGSDTSGQLLVSGTLQVCGQSRMIATELTHSADSLQSSFELTPSQFGIAPFKALGGAIRVQDHIRIAFGLVLDGHDPDALLGGTEPVQIVAAED